MKASDKLDCSSYRRNNPLLIGFLDYHSDNHETFEIYLNSLIFWVNSINFGLLRRRGTALSSRAHTPASRRHWQNVQEECPGNYWSGKYPGEKRLGRNDWIPCRITTLYVQRTWLLFVIPWLTSNTQTHITGRLTDRQTDTQLLTGYTISSAKLANKNSKRVILVTSFVICMTPCYMRVFLFVSLCEFHNALTHLTCHFDNIDIHNIE